MKEIWKELRQWLKAIGDERHRRKVLRRQNEAKQEACLRVQAREYGGELYFCFDNIPLLHCDDLTDKLGSIVREARDHYCDYRMTQELTGSTTPMTREP